MQTQLWWLQAKQLLGELACTASDQQELQQFTVTVTQVHAVISATENQYAVA